MRFYKPYFFFITYLFTSTFIIKLRVNADENTDSAIIKRNSTGDFLLNTFNCHRHGMYKLNDDGDCRCPPKFTFMKSSNDSSYGCLTYPALVKDCIPLRLSNRTINMMAEPENIVPLLRKLEPGSHQRFETENMPCNNFNGMSIYYLTENNAFGKSQSNPGHYFFILRNVHANAFNLAYLQNNNDIYDDYPGRIIKVYISACSKLYCIFFKAEGETRWISDQPIDPTSSSVTFVSTSSEVTLQTANSTQTLTSQSKALTTSNTTPLVVKPSSSIIPVQPSVSSTVIPVTTQSPTSEESSSDKDTIIGLATGLGVLFILVAIILICLVYRNREKFHKKPNSQIVLENSNTYERPENAQHKFQTSKSVNSLSDVVIQGIDAFGNPLYTTSQPRESPDGADDSENPYQNTKEAMSQNTKQPRPTSNFFLQENYDQ